MGELRMPPPAPPVGVEEVKAFLRIAASDEDALIAGLVRTAAETCERFTGRALVERPVEEMLPAVAGWIRLEAAPVRSIEAVAAVAADGGATDLPTGDYLVDIDAAGEGWVRLLRAGEAGRIRVSYTAGLAAGRNGVPEALRQGIVRLAAHLYGWRGGESGNGAGAPASAAPPAAVTALWRPWRRLPIGLARLPGREAAR